MDKKRFGKIQIIVFAVLIAVATSLWFGRSEVGAFFANSSSDELKQKKKSKKGVPVIVKQVTTAHDNVVIEAIGTARAKRFVTLYPETDGIVTEVKVQAGDRVEAKEVIIDLESEAEQLAVSVALTKLEEAQRQLGRETQLLQRRVKSNANVLDAKSVFDRAKLELAQAQKALSERKLVAPFAGIVGIPKVEPGDRVTTSSEIVTIDDRTTLLVQFEVPERYISRLEEGTNLTARTPTFDDRVFDGVIERIDSRVDPLSRTIRVRAAFENGKDELRPGMSFFVNLELPGKLYEVVPQLALQWDSGKSYVWKIVKGKSVKIPVQSIKRFGNKILVKGKLKSGDLVVVEGVQRLRKGRKVSYKKPKDGKSKGKKKQDTGA
jgi:membrane fusion protein (multidrug efflux system)